MKQFEYVIKDREGIHARPAGNLVKMAAGFKSSVTMEKEGKTADVKRIFAVMGLGVKQGQSVTFTVEGEDEETAAASLEAFMKENL
jgi:phosphocarrier protein HPr